MKNYKRLREFPLYYIMLYLLYYIILTMRRMSSTISGAFPWESTPQLGDACLYSCRRLYFFIYFYTFLYIFVHFYIFLCVFAYLLCVFVHTFNLFHIKFID